MEWQDGDLRRTAASVNLNGRFRARQTLGEGRKCRSFRRRQWLQLALNLDQNTLPFASTLATIRKKAREHARQMAILG